MARAAARPSSANDDLDHVVTERVVALDAIELSGGAVPLHDPAVDARDDHGVPERVEHGVRVCERGECGAQRILETCGVLGHRPYVTGCDAGANARRARSRWGVRHPGGRLAAVLVELDDHGVLPAVER